jgi:hypothetical protein
MKHLLILLTLLCVLSSSASAGNTPAGYMLSNCRDFIRADLHRAWEAGECAGFVESLRNAAPLMREPYRSCPPLNHIEYTEYQVIIVVVAWFEQHPDRWRASDDFTPLVLNAMRSAWPCTGNVP